MATSQSDFEKFLVGEYFKHGSINKVFSTHHFDLPISFAGYHRVLSKFGVIKSAGPNSQLSESLHILTQISTYKIPLERIYHRHAPRTIQVSTNTLHRILHYTRLGLTRRQGTALLISSENDPNRFLTGIEKNIPKSALGQKGDLALPMGHSKTGEVPKDAIARVLQQEIFTNLVINSMFPWEIIPTHPKPVMYINIADIRVAVYRLILPNIFRYSSFKLSRLEYRELDHFRNYSIRPGVEEICRQFINSPEQINPSIVPEFDSNLNLSLLALAKVPN